MPRSLIPPHGGPYAPAYQGPTARDSGTAPSASAANENRALRAEVERLRREVAMLRAARMAHGSGAGHSPQVLWAGIALCGVALLFAAIAICWHG